MASEAIDAVWPRLATALGMPRPRTGQRFAISVAAGITLAGEVESVDPQGSGTSVFARLDQPRPGTLFAGAFDCGGVMASLQVYVYGGDAAAWAERLRTPLTTWLAGLVAPAANA
jgi:hypothetical protein